MAAIDRWLAGTDYLFGLIRLRIAPSSDSGHEYGASATGKHQSSMRHKTSRKSCFLPPNSSVSDARWVAAAAVTSRRTVGSMPLEHNWGSYRLVSVWPAFRQRR
jgi:hypothetical protein